MPFKPGIISKIKGIVEAAKGAAKSPVGSLLSAQAAAKGFRIPKLTLARTGGLLGALALGAGSVLGATEIVEDIDKHDLAEAMVQLAIMSNPIYAAMSEQEKEEAIDKLQESFDKDPVLYAQAKQVYEQAKKAGII